MIRRKFQTELPAGLVGLNEMKPNITGEHMRYLSSNKLTCGKMIILPLVGFFLLPDRIFTEYCACCD
ncbi:protein of unknown function [Candidatus Nitrotoga arctica]|uniref:Uncharacterized protein n=1 Tax=Candidatus Nitrotoga arctica TaxID=453162 RepID=A0ABM8YYZ8_9PROT|nr:protein of unknown function [Candidatus Nitrotoga arctica]